MIEIRPIQKSDNKALALIIRATLSEFGAARPGTVYDDATTDTLFQLFDQDKASYFVATISGKIVGGGGLFPTVGLPENTCELVKMYLLPEARGKGIGKMLMEQCIHEASQNGFKSIYLETLPELKQAIKVYENFGFKKLEKPLGNSGHFGCDVWMLKNI